MEFSNTKDLFYFWKTLVKRFGYKIKEHGLEKDLPYIIAENEDYYLKLYN